MIIFKMYGYSILFVLMFNKLVIFPYLENNLKDDNYKFNDGKRSIYRLALNIFSFIPILNLLYLNLYLSKRDLFYYAIKESMIENKMIELDINIDDSYKDLIQENDNKEEIKQEEKYRFSNGLTRDELTIDMWKNMSVEEKKLMINEALNNNENSKKKILKK